MINIDLLSIGHNFWPGMANHLWQSTLFGAAAWLVTLFLKKNPARIRYWVWFSVTIKFLIPFSLLVGLGGLMAPGWMKTSVEIPPEWNVVHTINQPFNLPDIKEALPAIATADTPPTSNRIPVIIISLWLCGSFTLLLNWNKRGMRVSRILRKADLLIEGSTVKSFQRVKMKERIPDTVRLACTEDMMEPGVYGIFRPVLILPAGILDHVNDSELETILIHEFEHIRCRDNLTASIHMLVQTLFWFHPVVWWTGSRLIYERELACDESVLQSSKNPRSYAEGILKVCEYYFRSPLACVSGIIGSNLIKRVEGIMKNQSVHRLGILKKLFLLMTGLSVLGIPLALEIINAPDSQARPFDNAPAKHYADSYKPDSSRISAKPEMNIDPSGMVNEKADPVDLSVIPKIRNTSRTGVTETHEFKDINAAIATANAGLQTANDPEKITEKSGTVPKSAPDADIKDSIVPARGEDKVKVSKGSVSGDKESEIKDAGTYVSRGISSLKKGQIEDAVSSLSMAIDLDPRNAPALVVRGSAYYRLGDYDRTVSDYSRAIGINPELAVAYQNRGSAYYRQGNLDNAVSDYSRAIELNPDLAAAYQDRGSIYQSRKRLDDAISDYSRALNLVPDDAVLYNYRGSAYFAQGQHKKAFADFNRAIALNPGYVSAYINRGTYYNTLKDMGRAAADYRKALELNPESAFSSKLKEYINYADAQEIECRRIRFKDICLTKASWAGRKSGKNVGLSEAPAPGRYTGQFDPYAGVNGSIAQAIVVGMDNWARGEK